MGNLTAQPQTQNLREPVLEARERREMGPGELPVHYKGKVLWSSCDLHVVSFKVLPMLFLLPPSAKFYSKTPYQWHL